jgi:hypothetical protein
LGGHKTAQEGQGSRVSVLERGCIETVSLFSVQMILTGQLSKFAGSHERQSISPAPGINLPQARWHHEEEST